MRRRMARAALATLSGAWSVTGAVDEAKVEVLEQAADALGDELPALRARLLAALAAELTFSPDRRARRRLDPRGGRRRPVRARCRRPHR